MNIERNKVIAENIRSFIRSKNITQKELADAIKISPSTLSDYLNLRSNPSHGVIQKIADYFEVGKSDIDTTFKDASEYSLTSKVANIINSLTPPRQHKVYTFAQLQLDEQNSVINIDTIKEEPAEYITEGLYGRLSAGTGQQIFDNPVEDVKVPSAIIPDEPYDIMLKIVGDSMQPAFEDGEYVFIKLTKEIRSGQFAAIIVDDEAFLKKVYVEEDQMRLVSLNKNYEDIIVNEYSNIEVVGTVVL